MGQAIRPPGDEFLARIARLERRLGVVERMPSGAKAIGVRQIGQLPAARIRSTSSVAIGASGVPQAVNLTTVILNRGGMWDVGVPGQLTIPEDGVYGLSFGIRMTCTQADALMQGRVMVGADVAAYAEENIRDLQAFVTGSSPWECEAGDVVTLQAIANFTAGSAGITGAYNNTPFLAAWWVSS